MTVRELAAELNTSKTTIKNILKKLEISPQKQLEKGQEVIFLTEADIEQIKVHYFKKHPATNTAKFSEKGENITENVNGNTEKVFGNTENNTAKSENFEITEKLIEMLQQDLELKNKQIDDLNNRLSEAMKALDQEQQLKAIAERKILELEDKAAAAEEKKTRFKWFRKKDK